MERSNEILLKPSIPYIEGYGAAYSNLNVYPNWNPIFWDYIEFNTSDLENKPQGTSSRIVVRTTGIYLIEISLTFDCSNMSEPSAFFISRILKNGIEISGSRFAGSSIQNLQHYQTISTFKTVYLSVNDVITFQYITDDIGLKFADDMIANEYYSKFRLSFIPLGGWNNNYGGNIINRGVRR